MQQLLDWTVDRIGNGDPVMTALMFLVAIAAAHAGYHLMGFIQEKWSKRKL
jgi:hypothetical protein